MKRFPSISRPVLINLNPFPESVTTCASYGRMTELRASFEGKTNGLSWSMPENFRDVFCRVFDCAPASFERRVFWRCLYPHAAPLAWFILLVRPQFFRNDFKTIRQLGILRTREEIRIELDSLCYANKQGGGTLRNVFRIRVSGKRLMRLHAELLSSIREMP